MSKEIIEELTVSEQSGKVERKPKKKKSERKSERKEDKKELLSENVLARFTLKDVGYVDIKDKDTYQIAKMYLQLVSKKLGLNEEE